MMTTSMSLISKELSISKNASAKLITLLLPILIGLLMGTVFRATVVLMSTSSMTLIVVFSKKVELLSIVTSLGLHIV